MQHQWIIDMLQDMRTYAEANDLPQIAAGVQGLLPLAREEIAARQADRAAGAGGGVADDARQVH